MTQKRGKYLKYKDLPVIIKLSSTNHHKPSGLRQKEKSTSALNALLENRCDITSDIFKGFVNSALREGEKKKQGAPKEGDEDVIEDKSDYCGRQTGRLGQGNGKLI